MHSVEGLSSGSKRTMWPERLMCVLRAVTTGSPVTGTCDIVILHDRQQENVNYGIVRLVATLSPHRNAAKAEAA